MSKYIVDTDDFEHLFKVDSIGVMGIGKSLSDDENDHSWSRFKDVGEFEELTAEYVNEHYGSLQENAYRIGFEDGKKSTEKGCEGCKYEPCGDTEDPCWHCRKSYKDKYEPAPPSDCIEVVEEEPCIINEQTRQALNSAISVLSEAMDKIKEKLEIFNG